MNNKSQSIDRIHKNPYLLAKNYFSMALDLPKNSSVSINGEAWNPISLCIRAIELDPLFAEAYYYLLLNFKSPIIISRIEWGTFKISKKIIELDPNLGLEPYIHVVCNLQFCNWDEKDSRDLLVKAIELANLLPDTTNQRAFFYSQLLKYCDWTVTIAGEDLTHLDLISRAIELDSEDDAYDYYIAAEILHEEEISSISINGKKWSPIQLVLKSLEVKKGCFFACKLLCRLLAPGQAVSIDGNIYTRESLEAKIMESVKKSRSSFLESVDL